MSSNKLSQYSAKIKDVYVEVKDYKFFHSPYIDKGKERFIGRKKVKDRIVSILKNTKVKSGTYLIAGFRGMGKTSIIREAIENFNEKVSQQSPKTFWYNNILTSVPNLRFFKRFLGYTLGLVMVLFLLSKEECLIKVSGSGWIFILIFFLSNLVLISFNFEKNEEGHVKISWLYPNWIVVLYIVLVSTCVVLFLLSGLTELTREGKSITFFLLGIYVLFLASNFTMFFHSGKSSRSVWNFFNLIVISCAFVGLGLYFYNYNLFCGLFNCVNVDKINLKEFISPGTLPAYVRIIIGLFASYCLLTVFYFTVDLIGRILISLSSLWIKMNRGVIPQKYEKFEINLSLESLNELDVLRRITIQLEEYWIKKRNKFSRPMFDRKIYFLWKFIISNTSLSNSDYDTPTYETVLEKINILKKRLSGQVTSRKELKLNPNVSTGFQGGFARFAMPLGIYSNKDEINYPIANSKEAEDQLKCIFEEIDELRDSNEWDIRRFIFIIDELDKIEPYKDSNIQDREISDPILDNNSKTRDTSHYRRRQEAVVKLLSNLKGFLNVVRAKFFFIGGREMYDAALADISDRDSFYSSIFNDVIYVDSFFKDSTNEPGSGKGGITQMTEAYLCNIIMNRKFKSGINDNTSNNNLALLFERLNYKHENTFEKEISLSVNEIITDTEKLTEKLKGEFQTLKELKVLFYKNGGMSLDQTFDNVTSNRRPINLKNTSANIRWTFYNIVQLVEKINLLQKESNLLNTTKIFNHKIFKPNSNHLLYTFFNRIFKKFNLGKNESITKSEVNSMWFDLNNVFHLLPTEIYQELFLSADELKKQAYKTIFLLQNYIVYLTYRSNGTPKKLASLTETLIVNGPPLSRKEDNKEFLKNNVVVLHGSDNPVTVDLSEKLFLKFGFNTQYEIGLTANLYRPYLIANSRHLKSLGDKLLFSSSFIIDHILKFHPFGFSWRNLELIPEVVLVSREPNLRKFIEELMRFYSMTYIRDTVSGIFDYTFRSIVKRELIFLSKTSDLSSAAFNFTLDESLSIKRHYKRKLNELQSLYKTHTPTKKDNQFIHSLCFIQTILGDLHFYDKEFDEAIVFYTESIQALRLPNAITDRYITRHQFLLWLRNQLKLGLALEKIRAFDSAFSLYKTLILDTERYLDIVVSQENNKNKWSSSSKNISESEDHRTVHLLSMPFAAILAVTEKIRTDGITYVNLRRNQEEFQRIINPDPAKINKLYRDKIDLYRRAFLQADYYNNVGSILFYKNYQFSEFLFEEDCFLQSYEKHCYDNIAEQLKAQYSKDKEREYYYCPSLTPFSYYWNSLYFLLEDHREQIEKEIKKIENFNIVGNLNFLTLATGMMLPNCLDLVNSKRLGYIATVVSKIGDSILASLKKGNFSVPEGEFSFLFTSFSNIEDVVKMSDDLGKFESLIRPKDGLFAVEVVLNVYKLAAALFKRSGDISNYASHLIKMLYIVKDIIEVNKAENKYKGLLQNFIGNSNSPKYYEKIESVAITVFKATTWNNEVSNRPQILKYREIFGLIYDKNRDRELIYNNINNTTDNREVVILVESIKMKLGALDISSYMDKFNLGKSIISAYGSINNRYLRMLELKYRSERCYFIIKNIFSAKGLLDAELTTAIFKKEVIKDYFEKLIKDSSGLTYFDVILFVIKEALFSLRELIKMFKLYDPGYVIGYSFIAAAHERMGGWCMAYENVEIIVNHEFTFKEKLASIKRRINALDGDKKNMEYFALEAIIKKCEEFPSNQIENINTSNVSSILNVYQNPIIDNWIKALGDVKNMRDKYDAYKINHDAFIKDIKMMLGQENLAYLEPKAHYESAIQHYYKVIQLHTGGKTYKDKIHEVYMLEDDYNDLTAHYTIASERMRVNTGIINQKIEKLNKLIEESKLYTYESHLTSEAKDTIYPEAENVHSYLELFIKDFK